MLHGVSLLYNIIVKKSCLISFIKICSEFLTTCDMRVSAQVYDVKQAVYEFVSVGARGRGGSSPLHLACARDTSSVGRYPICNFPSVPTIELLLECGAPVDARDNVSGDI